MNIAYQTLPKKSKNITIKKKHETNFGPRRAPPKIDPLMHIGNPSCNASKYFTIT